MRRILLARIGWMKFYAGCQPNDEKPVAGGNYNLDNIGGEINTFRKRDAKLYGAFSRSAYSEGLSLHRIDAKSHGRKLDNVLVIFFAADQREDALGQVIVGWYTRATVFAADRMRPWWHLTETLTKNAVLLPTSRRNCVIPRGKNAPGQSNTFFVLDGKGRPKSIPWLKRVLEFIDGYEGPNLLRDSNAEVEPDIAADCENALATSLGQGVIIDPSARRVVENVAMKAAIRWFKRKGYSIKNVSSQRSYDLHCTKGKQNLHVEVKGTQAPLSSITLTPNEVKLAQSGKPVALFVQHSIKVKRKKKAVSARGGKSFVLNPWRLRAGELKPIAWKYGLI